MEPLDNAVWHALTGPHRTIAEGGVGAARYPVRVSPFGAVPDEPGAASWAALAGLVGEGGAAVLFRAAVEPPEGWEEIARVDGIQMIGADVGGTPCPEAVVLGADDVEDMRDLVKRTEPGPFGRRTIELGRYVGIRRDGRLVAMAGERMRLAGHTEISAVCTDPDVRGEGLAAALVRDVVAHIRDRGEVPFLHVVVDNTAAIALYRKLGFTTRRDITAFVLTPPTPEPSEIA